MEIKMEEGIISFVAAGCRLAQDLQSNLCRLKSSPENLLKECEQIADIFTAASHRLRALQSCHVVFPDHRQQQDSLLVSPEIGMTVISPEFTRELPAAGGGSVVGVGNTSGSSKGKEVIMPRIPGSAASGGISGGGDFWLPEYGIQGGGASGSAVGEGSSSQKTRKRKDESGKRTIEVAAPLHGNTEIPPDDGYTWRKYGQKWILNAKFPRAYYRCTHQRLYNCPAKKQVQSLNNNPQIFQVTYRGTHTCHMSSTAPASAIPPPPPVTAAMVAYRDVSLSNWFPINLTPQPLNNTTIFDTSFSMYSTQVTSGSGGGTTSSNGAVEHGATVVDMADAMFNSAAGSGGDSIDFIFSKYERGDAKH